MLVNAQLGVIDRGLSRIARQLAREERTQEVRRTAPPGLLTPTMDDRIAPDMPATGVLRAVGDDGSTNSSIENPKTKTISIVVEAPRPLRAAPGESESQRSSQMSNMELRR